jgi:hypothetical protein
MTAREAYDYLDQNMVLQPEEMDVVCIALEAKQNRMPVMVERYAQEIWELMYDELWPLFDYRITDHIFDRLWDRMINEDKIGFIIRISVKVGRQKQIQDIFAYGDTMEEAVKELCEKTRITRGKVSYANNC